MLGWAAQIPPEDRGTPPFLSYQKCWLPMVPTWVVFQQTELSYPMSWFFPGGNLHPVTGQQGDTNVWKLVLKEDNSESLTPFQRSLWGSAEGSMSTISQLPPLSLPSSASLAPYTWSSWQHFPAHLLLTDLCLQVHFLQNQAKRIPWGKFMLSDSFINEIPYSF